MENKVFANFEKSEKTMRARRQYAAEILAEDKEKVAEVRRLAPKNMVKRIVVIL